MSDKTPIEWTDATWSPLRVRVRQDAAEIARARGYASLVQSAETMATHVGPHCEHISDGCENCYSGTNNHRCLPTNGTGLPFDRRARDLVEPFLDVRILEQPLRWRKPKRVFVENQSDLFGEWWPDEMIDRIFAVMALCPQHTFQVLTKRADRMREYMTFGGQQVLSRVRILMEQPAWISLPTGRSFPRWPQAWPLPNVWPGFSAEDQETFDRRWEFMRTLAAQGWLTWCSYEPALGPIDFSRALVPRSVRDGFAEVQRRYPCDPATIPAHLRLRPSLDWVVIGGESGPGARPFDLAWARQAIAQCKAAGVPVFVKQMGAKPVRRYLDMTHSEGPDVEEPIPLRDRKGGDMAEWAEDLRVREYPR